jgi:hypothetical protein
MTLHFQVFANISLTGSKMAVVNTSICHTTADCTRFEFVPNKRKDHTICRIFPTLEKAQEYIVNLYSQCPPSMENVSSKRLTRII